MGTKIILGLALVLSGALFGCSTTAHYHTEPVSVPEIKITFAKRRFLRRVICPMMRDTRPALIQTYMARPPTSWPAGFLR
jgi:hypothetical protein